MNNIYLCGFMGSGKTTVAAALSRTLNVPAYDTDKLITDACGMPIPDIFAKHGEAYFRQVESSTLKKTGDFECCVFATGGGILTNEENGPLLRSLGTLIYLKTPFNLCYQRIKGDENRPLAFSKSRSELLELYLAREAVYQQYSHFSITCGNRIKPVAEEIIRLTGIDEFIKKNASL